MPPLPDCCILLLTLHFLLFGRSVLGQVSPSSPAVENRTSDSITDHLNKSCGEGVSWDCFKSGVAGLMSGLTTRERRLQLGPGLTVSLGGERLSLPPPPTDLAKVDGYLVTWLRGLLASLSLQVSVIDDESGQRLGQLSRMLSDIALTTTADKDDDVTNSKGTTGRRRRVNSTLMMGGLMTLATLLALGMAGISAMAGKALMTSLLSLGMTLLSNRNGGGGAGGGGGGGAEKTTYEIIHALPAVAAPAVHHHISSEQWAGSDQAAHDTYQILKGH